MAQEGLIPEFIPMIAILLLTSTILVGDALPVPRNGSCPQGYYTTGNSCAPTSSYSKPAIPKSGSSCPTGWASSYNYCVRNR